MLIYFKFFYQNVYDYCIKKIIIRNPKKVLIRNKYYKLINYNKAYCNVIS